MVIMYSISLPVGIKSARNVMFDDEWIKRLNVCVKCKKFRVRLGQISWIQIWKRILHNRRCCRCCRCHVGLFTFAQSPAVVITVTPNQFLARSFWRNLIAVLTWLIKLFPLCKNFSEWILAYNRLPVNSVQNCFAPARIYFS